MDAYTENDIQALLDSGVTAIVCATTHSADIVRRELQKAEISVPARSLAAVGCMDDIAPCSGYYCSARQLADGVVGLLRDGPGTRPATLWLAGTWHDLEPPGPPRRFQLKKPRNCDWAACWFKAMRH